MHQKVGASKGWCGHAITQAAKRLEEDQALKRNAEARAREKAEATRAREKIRAKLGELSQNRTQYLVVRQQSIVYTSDASTL